MHFNKVNESKTNVTELTKGVYIIGLTVTDGNGNNASDIVKITVYQSKYRIHNYNINFKT